jgi:hypothetical protein
MTVSLEPRITTVVGAELTEEGSTAARAAPANPDAAMPMPLIRSNPLADNLTRFIAASLERHTARQLSLPA